MNIRATINNYVTRLRCSGMAAGQENVTEQRVLAYA